MTQLPNLLAGPIASEYAAIFASKKAQSNDQTQTCGSDCSDGRACNNDTCGQQNEEGKSASIKKMRKNAFLPVVPGWNEPPAAYL